MKTFTQFRSEVDGYNDVKDTVEAEEKIAVSSVRLLMDRNKLLEKFNDELRLILNKFLVYKPSFVGDKFVGKTNINKRALLMIGGDKGMVGNLWDNLVTFDEVKFANYEKIIIFGKTTFNEFSFSNKKYDSKLVHLNIDPKYRNELEGLRSYIINIIKNEDFDMLDVMWPHVVTLNNFKPEVETIFPFKIDITNENSAQKDDELSWPIINPSSKKFFNYISKLFMFSRISQIIIEKQLSESLSRAVAMENAKNEVNKIIKKVRYNFLTERKRVLTKNQIEIFMAHKVINRI